MPLAPPDRMALFNVVQSPDSALARCSCSNSPLQVFAGRAWLLPKSGIFHTTTFAHLQPRWWSPNSTANVVGGSTAAGPALLPSSGPQGGDSCCGSAGRSCG